MKIRAGGVRVAYPLFQAEGSGSIPTSALQLRFETVNMKVAQSLNRLWHSRLPKTILSNLVRNRRYVAYVAEFDGLFYATAIWTDPVAANRMVDGDLIIELRRMAIADDAPKNSASRMLGWMIRDIKRRYPECVKCVSYQDTAVHNGTIYKASGWTAIDTSDSQTTWSTTTRLRNAEQSSAIKQRWELILKPPTGSLDNQQSTQ